MAPDFENAGDTNTDNVYLVQVTVTDSGGLTDVQDIAVTVTDVEALISVAVSPDRVTEDGNENLVYTFTRTGPTDRELTVNFSTTGSATAGTDFTATASDGVTFGVGASTTTVTVDPTADTSFETDETVIMTVNAGSDYTTVVPASATGRITEDDSATLTFSIVKDSITENEGVANMTKATVSRNDADLTNELVVFLNANPEGIDEINLPASVTIPPGQSSVEFEITAIDDLIIDGTQTVTVTATTLNPHQPGSDVVNVIDNDGHEVCAISGVELDASNGTLRITGTDGRDRIVVSRQGSKLRVRTKFAGENWVTTEFKYSEVTSIVVEACGGNDQVQIHRRVEQETTIAGGPGNDNIRTGNGAATVDGGPDDDFIWTGNGNDTVTDLEGRNIIRTGSGDNTVTTGKGNDLILTGEGDDTITDGGGVNAIYAGNGNNVIDTGNGRDFVITGKGNDSIKTGGGNDIVFAGGGDDDVYAGDGADRVYAGDGDDIVRGGSENDILYGDDGNDILLGEGGDDRLYGLAGRDLLIGGLGADILDGGRQDDILIGAVNKHDDKDLEAILDIWTSNESYIGRVNKLRGADGGLLNSKTVRDDLIRDRIRALEDAIGSSPISRQTISRLTISAADWTRFTTGTGTKHRRNCSHAFNETITIQSHFPIHTSSFWEAHHAADTSSYTTARLGADDRGHDRKSGPSGTIHGQREQRVQNAPVATAVGAVLGPGHVRLF